MMNNRDEVKEFIDNEIAVMELTSGIFTGHEVVSEDTRPLPVDKSCSVYTRISDTVLRRRKKEV